MPITRICCKRERHHDARRFVPDPYRARRRPAARLRGDRGREPDLGRGDPTARRHPLRGTGPAAYGRLDRGGPGGDRAVPAAAVLPAHRAGRGPARRGARTATAARRGGWRAAAPPRRDPGRWSGMTGQLERRYRRLLALYPADYRAEYEEEMIGVLLALSTSERRFPGWREALDLLWTAVRVRATRGWTEVGGTGWTTAMGALGVVGALLLAGKGLRPIVDAYTWNLRFDVPIEHLVNPVDWLRAAGWTLLALVVLCRLRVIAAALAWVAVLAEAVLRIERPPDFVRSAVELIWPILLVGLVAVALTAGARATAGARTLGGRRLALVGLAAAVVGASAAVMPLLFIDERPRSGQLPSDGFSVMATMPMSRLPWTSVPAGVIMAVLLALALTGFAPTLRRRLVALTASALTLVVAANLGLDMAFAEAIYRDPPLIPPDLHLPLVLLAPTLVLLVSVLLIRARERSPPVLHACPTTGARAVRAGYWPG